MKKLQVFSVVCAVIFLWGAISIFRVGRGVVEGSTISYALDIALQLIVGGIFVVAGVLLRSKDRIALRIFKTGCISAVLYIVVRCVESVLNARQAGLDDLPAIPIIAVTGFLLASVFVYFFVVSRRQENP